MTRDCAFVRYSTATVQSGADVMPECAVRVMKSASSSSSDPRKYLMRSPPLRSVHSRLSLRFRFWLMTAEAASRMTCVDR